MGDTETFDGIRVVQGEKRGAIGREWASADRFTKFMLHERAREVDTSCIENKVWKVRDRD